MTRSLQELSDRVDLQDLVTRYATCVDARDMDGLDSVFTPDAHVDYSASGGMSDGYPQVKAWLGETLPIFSSTQHLVSNLAVTLSGNSARGRCMCFNPMAIDLPGEGRGPHVMFFGLWYRFDFVRTPDGWRIASLDQEKAYHHNADLS